MFVFLIICIILTASALLTKHWGIALGLYMLSGVLFVTYNDKRIPRYNKPSYLRNPILKYLMVLIWPLPAFISCQEFLYARNQPDRFLLHWDLSSDKPGSEKFKSFEEAVSFAREKAKRIKDIYGNDFETLFETLEGEDLEVLLEALDNAIVIIYDQETYKYYEVDPSGKVKIVKGTQW